MATSTSPLACAIEAHGELASVLSPLNVKLLAAANTALTAAIDAADWPQAKAFAMATVQQYMLVYPASHPIIGLQQLMLGRILWYLEESQLALVALRSAYSLLSVTHGYDCPLTQELSALINEAQSEVSHKSMTKPRPAMKIKK
jgi:SET and MYND domain-containing protein